ncbi:hypothetical protein BOX15_Mlig015447g3, partial [Macrostomum lignano]
KSMGKHKQKKHVQEEDAAEPVVDAEPQEAEVEEAAAAPDGAKVRRPQVKMSYEEQLNYVTPIANPMAPKKVNKKLLKLIRKAKRGKKVHQGVKLIPKLIVKKRQSGIVVIAGDVTPIDVVSHLPLLLEEHSVPYCYSPSKREIGAACGSRRGIALVFVQRHDDFGDLFDKMRDKLLELPLPIS